MDQIKTTELGSGWLSASRGVGYLRIRVYRVIRRAREVPLVQNLRRRLAEGGAERGGQLGQPSRLRLRKPSGRPWAFLCRFTMAGPGPGAALESPRQLLGRVRFLAEAAQSLRAGRPLPAALAFVPREVLYKLYKDPAGPSRVLLPVWEAEGLGLRVGAAGSAPGTGSGPLRAARDSIELRRGACVRTTGEELCNGHGLWVKLTKVLPGLPWAPQKTPGAREAPGCSLPIPHIEPALRSVSFALGWAGRAAGQFPDGCPHVARLGRSSWQNTWATAGWTKAGCWCADRRRAGPASYPSTLQTTSSGSSSSSEWTTDRCSGPALEGARLAA